MSQFIVISDNEGFTGLAEYLHTRTKSKKIILLEDTEEYVSPSIGKTVVISIDEAINSFTSQLNILRTEFDSIEDMLHSIKKVRLPINRVIDRNDLDSTKVIKLIELQDDIVHEAMDIARTEINPDVIFSLQRELNLHRHTLDGSMVVDHPIEIVREVVEHSMKQLYSDEKFIEEHSDQVVMDPYHKSIRDQITMIDERLLAIEHEHILPTDGSEYFVAKMVELGNIRKGLTVKDSGSDHNVVFTDLMTLSKKIDKLFLDNNVSHLNDNYIKLIECQHISVKRAPKNTEPEVTPTQKVLGVSLAMLVCGAVIGGFNYFFGD